MSIFGPRPKAGVMRVKKSYGYAAHNILECTCMLCKSIAPLVNELEPGQTLCDGQKHRQTRTQTHRHTDTQIHRHTDRQTDRQTHWKQYIPSLRAGCNNTNDWQYTKLSMKQNTLLIFLIESQRWKSVIKTNEKMGILVMSCVRGQGVGLAFRVQK